MDKQSSFLFALQPHSLSFKKLRSERKHGFHTEKLQLPGKNHQSPIMKAKNNFEQFYKSIGKKSFLTSDSDKSTESLANLFPLEQVTKIKETFDTLDPDTLSEEYLLFRYKIELKALADSIFAKLEDKS